MTASETNEDIHPATTNRRRLLVGAGIGAVSSVLTGLDAAAQPQPKPPRFPASVAPENTVSAQSARWLEALTWDRIPENVRNHAKLRMLDVLGVMLATTRWAEARQARDAVMAYDKGQDAKPIGVGGAMSIPSAAFVNGVLGAVLEFDDTHTATAIHVTAPTVSAGFPVAQSLRSSGKDLIVAIVGGGELTCRIGLIGPRMSPLSIHPTGLFGIFGAVYTHAKLLGLDDQTIINAIGICASMSAGSRAAWDEGSDAKSLQVGIAASSGVRSVLLAKSGLTGPSSIFESDSGFFRAHVQSEKYPLNFSAMTNRLGEVWESLTIASKAYPTGYVTHPFMEAALILRSRNTFNAEDIVEIEASGPEYMLETRDARSAKLRPRTPWHARVSVYHQVAEAIILGKIDKNAFLEQNLRNPRINALADKVHLRLDPVWNDPRRSGGAVVIKFKNGRQLSHTIENMRGTALNPITEADYVAKFRSNAEGVIAPALIADTISKVLNLDRVENVATVLDPLTTA